MPCPWGRPRAVLPLRAVAAHDSESPGAAAVSAPLPAATRRISSLLVAIGIQHGAPWHRHASILRALISFSFAVRAFAFVAVHPGHPARALSLGSGIVELSATLWRLHFAWMPCGRWFDALVAEAVRELPHAERAIERAANVCVLAVVQMLVPSAIALFVGTFSALIPEMAESNQYPWGVAVNAVVFPLVMMDLPLMAGAPAAFAVLCVGLISRFDSVLCAPEPGDDAVAGFRRVYTTALSAVSVADVTLGSWMRTSVALLVLLVLAMLQAILFGATTSFGMTFISACMRFCGAALVLTGIFARVRARACFQTASSPQTMSLLLAYSLSAVRGVVATQCVPRHTQTGNRVAAALVNSASLRVHLRLSMCALNFESPLSRDLALCNGARVVLRGV